MAINHTLNSFKYALCVLRHVDMYSICMRHVLMCVGGKGVSTWSDEVSSSYSALSFRACKAWMAMS